MSLFSRVLVVSSFAHANGLSTNEHGSPLTCSYGTAAIGACTSGKNKDCSEYGSGGKSHALQCSSSSVVENYNSINWKTKELTNVGNRDAWLFCGEQEAIFARCAGGSDEDCKIGSFSDYDFGIKCGKMKAGFFLREQGGQSWVCADHGKVGQCPYGSLAVATCASGANNDCDWGGCTNKETYTGLLCHEYVQIPATPRPTPRPTPRITYYPEVANTASTTYATLYAEAALEWPGPTDLPTPLPTPRPTPLPTPHPTPLPTPGPTTSAPAPIPTHGPAATSVSPKTDNTSNSASNNNAVIGGVIGSFIAVLFSLCCYLYYVKKIKSGTSDNDMGAGMPTSAPPQNPGFSGV